MGGSGNIWKKFWSALLEENAEANLEDFLEAVSEEKLEARSGSASRGARLEGPVFSILTLLEENPEENPEERKRLD